MALKDAAFLWNDVDTPAVRPPVDSRQQLLPFGELSWENFERLCYRLAHHGRNVEDVRLYGTPGQAQEGIDLFVRRASGEYETWQCKRYQEITKADIGDAVTKFLGGDWAARTQEFRLAVAPSLKATALAEEVERQRERCNARKISLVILDADRLSEELKELRPWSTTSSAARGSSRSTAPRQRRACVGGSLAASSDCRRANGCSIFTAPTSSSPIRSGLICARVPPPLPEQLTKTRLDLFPRLSGFRILRLVHFVVVGVGFRVKIELPA
jgi:hypothetical protein